WRVEGVGRARVRADRLDADADDRALIRQPLSQLDIDARRVRTGFVRIQESLLVTGTGVPAGAVKQPAALGPRAVLPLERPNAIHGQQIVRVGLRLPGLVDQDRWADQPLDRHLRDIVLVLAGHPVDRRVEMGAGVFTTL